jgi:2-hydroxy-3-keto-5-methylthiopentenyl-1-phosphate phosphatase
MKLKEGYLLKNVAVTNVVISVENMDFDGMITLNDTGVFIWNRLEKGCSKEELLDSLLAEYEVSHEQAKRDLELFLSKLRNAELIDE